jgi:CubicO group peptidase (beta-lactamase class C family)
MNKNQWLKPANAVLILLFLLGISQPVLTSPVVKGPIARVVDEYLGRIVPYGFSGAVLVAKDDRIILNKGYGMAVRVKNIPNTNATVLNTGSITKQFTAAAIMKLEVQRKLKTSDPITKFFKNVPADKKNITLHHLLTHTSGIVDAVGDDYEVAKRDETTANILKEPLQFTLGKEFSYSNAGYSLLAAVIEKVSGQDYEKFLNEQLFKPAGMHFTGYRIPKWNERVVAHWYVGEKDNGTPLEKPYPYWHVIGNGEILSTTGDLYKWHLALKGDKILSKEAKKKIFTPYLNDYGYGWDVLESGHGLLIQSNYVTIPHHSV